MVLYWLALSYRRAIGYLPMLAGQETLRFLMVSMLTGSPLTPAGRLPMLHGLRVRQGFVSSPTLREMRCEGFEHVRLTILREWCLDLLRF